MGDEVLLRLRGPAQVRCGLILLHAAFRSALLLRRASDAAAFARRFRSA